MKTAIIILNYNNVEDTIRCIKSIYATTPIDKIEVVVVDNGSKGDIVATLQSFIEQFAPSVKLITLPKNIGYARANNAGYQSVADDNNIEFLAIMNNDIILTQDIVTPLTAKLSTTADCALISPLIRNNDGAISNYSARRAESLRENFIKWMFLHRDCLGILSKIAQRRNMTPAQISQRILEIDIPSGCCFIVRKSLFGDLGGFDPNTFLYYEEDILCSKIRKLGLKNYLDASISVIHKGGATTSEVSKNFIARTLVESNRYYIYNYTGAGLLYRCAMEIFYALYRIKIGVKSLIRR